MQKKGFTLIELLVVIAIIAILAAILFPVFAKAKETARQTTCQSNLKQLTSAVMLYVQDNNETFPKAWMYPGKAWYQVIGKYVRNKQIYRCLTFLKNGSGSAFCYGWNIGTTKVEPRYHDGMGYYYGDGMPYIKMSSVNATTRTVLLSDLSWDTYGGGNDVYTYYVVGYSNYLPAYHSGGGNYGFVDGHVKWYSRDAAYANMSMFLLKK